MSPEDVKACYRLYAACRMSRKIGPFRRILTSIAVQLGHGIFKETFAQMANLR